MLRLTRANQRGFSHVVLLIVIVVIGVVGFAGWKVFSQNKKSDDASGTNTNSTKQDGRIQWTFEGDTWKPNSTPPKCSTPLLNESPVDMSTVTAVLYPGQVRGQYKAHGGFHFRNNKTNDVTVKMPVDGYIVDATRYIQTGDNGVDELQYYVTFINNCGVAIKFDHLLTLSPEVQKIMDTRPEAKLNDTGSIAMNDGPLFKQGAVIATAVGQKSNISVGVDFGVYDYRQKNAASKNAAYAAAHTSAGYTDLYATCFLDDLPAADATIARSLPAGDGKMGKTSDYCK